MNSLQYILAQPEQMDSVGWIYPLQLKNYDEFQTCSYLLNYSHYHFANELQTHPLLDLIVFGLGGEKIVEDFARLFRLVLRCEVRYVGSEGRNAFASERGQIVHSDNYEAIRAIVMKQNLLFEPKVYDHPLVAEWARKSLKAKADQGSPITIESMVNTVSVLTGKSYETLAEQTIYQLVSDFRRIARLQSYEAAIAFKCAGADKVVIPYFGETIDMFENPYAQAFVRKEALHEINRAIR